MGKAYYNIPAHPEKADSKYKYNGVANAFMIFEPLAYKHETIRYYTAQKNDFAKRIDKSAIKKQAF